MPVAPRLLLCVAALATLLAPSSAQEVVGTILLPDSFPKLQDVRGIVFHAPTGKIYVGGEDTFLLAVDAQANVKLDRRVNVGPCPIDIFPYRPLCSDPPGNKIYCGNRDCTVTVIDGATSRPIKTVPVEQVVTSFAYVGPENKLYCASDDSLLRVIDCAGDSLVARIAVGSGASALCYNPQLNRIYSAHPDRDEVRVIDCAGDTVVATVAVRGSRPGAICFDSASGSVYATNGASGNVSVIDCAGDTVSRLVATGQGPFCIVPGPPGKVYCANVSDSTVSAISASGVRNIVTGRGPCALTYDPVNNKVCCADYYDRTVAVIDAAGDSVLARFQAGSYPRYLCYNPAGSNTYAAFFHSTDVQAVGGVSNAVEHVLPLGRFSPRGLLYNDANGHLYSLDAQNDLLFIIDGDSRRVLEPIKTGNSPAGLILSPARNKVYFTSGGSVSILDCGRDSVIARVATGSWTRMLCISDGGDVYVAVEDGVAVIDGGGDSIRAVVPVPNNSTYSAGRWDQADGKLYVGYMFGDSAAVRVIDGLGDSVVASVRTWDGYGFEQVLCWDAKYDKLYVGYSESDSVVVIDCGGDSILKKIPVSGDISLMYSDSVCDKVYCFDDWSRSLRVINSATDTFYRSLTAGYVTAILDNGKRGAANRLYCAEGNGWAVSVVAGYGMDSVLTRIPVGEWASALAWDSMRSRVYVACEGRITVLRDTVSSGVEEGEPPVIGRRPEPTVVRGVLSLPEASGLKPQAANLLDASGRRVMALKPGANDVSGLVPGVYFVSETGTTRAAFRRVMVVR